MTTPTRLYTQRFRLLDSTGEPYLLRTEATTSFVFRYREAGAGEGTQFTEIFRFNIDNVRNYIWVELPVGTFEYYMVINVAPLRTIQTALKTTTFSEGVETIEAYGVPVVPDSHQGFSPYINPLDSCWYQYSDLDQCFYNTNIKAVDTTGSGHPIVDYIEAGVMSGVTSNAVAGLKAGYDSQFNSINQQISVLDGKSVTVTVNGTTYSADTEGDIDLGEIKTKAYNDETTRRLATNETIGSTIVPKGSLVTTSAYGDTTNIVALSSNHDFYEAGLTTDNWWRLLGINGSCQLNVRIQLYNNSYAGVVYVVRNAYDYRAITTSQEIANHIKLYQSGVNAMLVMQGSSHVGVGVDIEVLQGTPNFLGTETPSLDERYNEELAVFLTDIPETEDYITITASPYQTSFSELDITNFNVQVQDCQFEFTDEVTETPLTLRYVAMQDDTIVTVTDSTGSWTATSSAMTEGQVGILTITEEGQFWSYTVNRDFETTLHKVTAVTDVNRESTVLYPSLRAMSDFVADYVEEEMADTVSSVTVNNKTYYQVNGDVNLGEIGGGAVLDYDYTFTGYQGYDHTAGTPTENILDFGTSQPRNTMNFKIDSGVTWEYCSTAYPVLSVSSATYSNQTLVLTFDNDSTGSTLYVGEEQSSQAVNPLAVTVYNYMTQTQQPVSDPLIIPANARVIYTLEYNSTGGYWSVQSQQTGSTTGNYVESVKVGDETYRAVKGVVTLPDYGKAVSGLSWNENNSTLTYKKINGEQDNITMNITDQYAKRQVSNVTLTVPSTEGVDKWVQICYIQHNTSLTSHTYADLHVEHIDADGLATGSDIKLRSTSTGSTLDAENQGDLSVWVSNQGCYVKVNTTAETNIDIYIDDSNTTGGLMGVYTTGGSSMVATALAMGKHRDWDAYTTTTQPAKEVTAESGGSSMVFDESTGALTGAKNKSGEDVTLYFNSVTFTV